MKKTRVGKLIKLHRTSLGLPANVMAKKAGISPQHLSDIERGARFPSVFVLQKIEKFFNQAGEGKGVFFDFAVREDLYDQWKER